CSELHVDLTPDGDTRGALVNKNDPRCFEIWNLVFIQFNANAGGTFSPLPQRHVDTGMGFERVTAIVQGTRNLTDFSGAISNYETDIFRPIFDELEKLSGKKYGSTIPKHGSAGESDEEKIDIAFRVIADHIRTLAFAIADGIIPSNEGRGYVLRRVLRRAVRYGRTLDFHQPFFFKLVDVVAQTMGDVFAEVRAKLKTIKETICREEESFNKTLDKGIETFNRMMEALERDVPKVAPLGGYVIMPERFAFELYDTYGFPIDLTELMARERGFTVDAAGFEKHMQEQRARARAAQKMEVIEPTGAINSPPTEFLGYDELDVTTTVLGPPGQKWLIVERTPFYAAMGGQISDNGRAETASGAFDIKNVLKTGTDVFVHWSEKDFDVSTGSQVRLIVNASRRHAIERHHTVTHLLHWALHEIVSRDAAQKGSYVGPDKLTFDFSSAALTPRQKREVEKLVNEKIAENVLVSWTEIPYAEAKKRSDIQQFFGEKYGDRVRVVQIGGEAKALDGYSMELCGGTHVRSTAEIGVFRIVSEYAIAAGIRRIEAVAGDAARVWAEEEAARQQERFEILARKKSDLGALPTFAREAETAEMLRQTDARAAHLEKVDVDVREWEKKNAKASDAQIKSRAAEIAKGLAASCAGKDFCVSEVPKADGRLLGAVVDALKAEFKGPIFLAGAIDGRVALIASVPKEMTSKFQANKLIQETAALVGGKGGGRPESAQGGGTDASKINQALDRAKKVFTG
ncbi:MAG: alanine--tRNA ligase, partial [Verrucomicrobia bacterium]